VSRPKALDLFCGAGGVSIGLDRAGFDVTGVDIKPQPRYRGGTFVQADAMTFPLNGFDFIWASPPCQHYSNSTPTGRRESHPDLVSATRRCLEAQGAPWAMENVPGAPMRHGVVLCGAAFGLIVVGEGGTKLHLKRHRLIEPSFPLLSPPCGCGRADMKITVVGDGTPSGPRKRLGRNQREWEKREVMGIDWMNRRELAQAIPPAYAEFIGRQAMREISQAGTNT
jgi:DNA (cytosine-5)-methyltransferase 1